MSNSANDNPVLNPNYQYKAVKAVMRGSVFEITLNRPERLNTFNAEMQKDFTALQMQIERNPEIRCITLFAEGERAFGAGADLSWFEQDWKMPEFRVHYRWIHDFFDVLERVEIPVIAAVFGTCQGTATSTVANCYIAFPLPMAKAPAIFAARVLRA